LKYYSDEQNKKAGSMLFYSVQVFVLLIVYSFVYTSFLAVNLTRAESSLTFMAYIPEVLASVVFPAVFYKSRQMFQNEKRVPAVGWMMGWAAMIIGLLYLHLSRLAEV